MCSRKIAISTTAEMLRGVQMVEVTASGTEALALFGNGNPAQLVLVDSQLADMSAFDFVRRVRAVPSPPKVIIVARVITQRLRAAARAGGAEDRIEKSQMYKQLPPILQPS